MIHDTTTYENGKDDVRIKKLQFESSVYTENFCFSKKKAYLATYSNFEFEKMGTKNFLSWPNQ